MYNKNEKKSENWKNWIAIFTVGLLLILVYKLLDNFTQIGEWIGTLFSVLTPFLVGLLIAYLLYMPCRGLENLYKKTKKKNFINKHARALSVATVYIIATLIIVIVLIFVIPAIIDSAIEFVSNIQNYYNEALQAIDQLPAESFLKSEIVTNAIAKIQNIDLERFTNLESIINYLKGAFNIVNGIFSAFVAFVVSIYILVERTQILSFLKRLAKAIFKKDTYLRSFILRLNSNYIKISFSISESILISSEIIKFSSFLHLFTNFSCIIEASINGLRITDEFAKDSYHEMFRNFSDYNFFQINMVKERKLMKCPVYKKIEVAVQPFVIRIPVPLIKKLINTLIHSSQIVFIVVNIRY